jgi:hypothetical protein
MLRFANPQQYHVIHYEGTDLLYTTTSNVAIGSVIKGCDLPYMNLSGGTPNFNLINTGGGWEGLNFYGNSEFYSLNHADGAGLQFIHGSGPYNFDNPCYGPYWDKTLFTLTPDVVSVGDGTTNTRLQVYGDINYTGKLYKNGVEFAGLTELLWTKDASNNINYASGKVGIGVTIPSYKLHVAGDIYANGGWLRVSGNQGLYFESHGGGFYMDDDTWIKTFNNKSFYQNTGILRTDGVFQVGADGSRFLVTQAGNTGIGTTAPVYKLDVTGDINYTGKLLKNGVEVIGGGSGSIWTKDASNNISYTDGIVQINTFPLAVGTDAPSEHPYRFVTFYDNTMNASTKYVNFGKNNSMYNCGEISFTHISDNAENNRVSIGLYGSSSRLEVLGNGCVGIGTATPYAGAKLTVKGKIVASEILIKDISEIPDYVFKTDYKLMPLHEVEKFVNINRHLPEVPSEKEFKENGMNMAEMNAMLLKKVEELTLYMIEMKKEIEILKKK